MSNTEVVQSRRLWGPKTRLHIAAQGVALSQKRMLRAAERPLVSARYEDIERVDIKRSGRGCVLLLQMRDGMQDWVVPYLSDLEAQWAADLINDQVRVLQQREDILFTTAVDFPQLAARVEDMLAEPGGIRSAIDTILLQAALHQASDVHFEPFRDLFRIRFRIDGVLRDVLELEPRWHRRAIARLKVISNLTVYRRDIPQEGRSTAHAPGRTVDLRLAMLPTLHGEKAVVRLFDPQRALLEVDELGMPPKLMAAFATQLDRPQGMILLTGPSNSGKTTTMYAALQHLHDHRRNLVSMATVEDPIEHDLRVAAQTQVDPRVGLSFAVGLRTVLRQDPEVILIGEIRDPETAGIAVRAGLTGHLILSTVHSPDTASVFLRLMDLEVEPFLVASSVSGVLSQRLVRKVCRQCARPAPPESGLLKHLGLPADDPGPWTAGAGCPACGGTGYEGRTGIFQWLPVTDAIRDLVLRKAPAYSVREAARNEGMRSLREDGLERARAGVTTLEELARVIGPELE